MNNYGKLILLTGIFVGSLITANFIAGVKIVNLWGFIIPAGFLAYAITFPITDITSEVYGERTSYYIVWSGFIANCLMLILVYIGLLMPPLTPEMQNIYTQAFTPVGRIVLASMLAYIISQHHDIWAFLTWKKITKGKWLWLRNNASTIISQLIDTVVFITVAFYGTIPLNTLVTLIGSHWLWKTIIALCDTPFVYLGVTILRRAYSNLDIGVQPQK